MGLYRITFKEWLVRSYLNLLGWGRYTINKTETRELEVPKEYELVFSEDFKNNYYSRWYNSAIIWEQPYHPELLDQWYDKDQVQLTRDGISLGAIEKPKYFAEIGVTIPNAVARLKTKESWKYGIFVFKAKLPKGKHLWPALWLSGSKNWPPEIDVLEGYSGDTIDYYKNTRLQSNVHMKLNGKHAMVRAVNHPVTKEVTNEFLEYIVWWEKDFIRFYYDGYLVREITDKLVLNLMNEEQIIILNSAIQPGFNKDNITPFVIKKVEVYQK